MSLKILEKGLSIAPEEINLLILQCEVYRSTGEREKSFKAGLKILNKYPKRWEGYALASQDLAIMKDFPKAELILERGFKNATQKNKLIPTAIDVYRVTGNSTKSEAYSQLFKDELAPPNSADQLKSLDIKPLSSTSNNYYVEGFRTQTRKTDPPLPLYSCRIFRVESQHY